MAVTQPMLALPITLASSVTITLNFSYLESAAGAHSFDATVSSGTYYNHFGAGGLVDTIVDALNAAETSEGSGGTWTDGSSVSDFEGVTYLARAGHVNDVPTSLVSTLMPLIGNNGNTYAMSEVIAPVFNGQSAYQRKYVWLPREWPIFSTVEPMHLMSMDETRSGKRRYRYFKELSTKIMTLENIPAALVYDYYSAQSTFVGDLRNSTDKRGLDDATAGDPNMSLESFVRAFLNDSAGYVTTPVIRVYDTWDDASSYETMQFSDKNFLEKLGNVVKAQETTPLWYSLNIPLKEYVS